MSDGLLQSLSSRGSVSRRNLLARATRRLAGLSGGLFVAIGLEEALARNGSLHGHLGGRHGKNKRGRHHKHRKHHKHKGPGGGAGCRNDSQCKQSERCCNGTCVDPQTNANHCGGCGKKCSSGFCRAAQCVDCTVCADCSSKTIQAAVNASSPNATIWICKGTYNERVLVNKTGLKLNALVAGNETVTIDGGGLASPDPVLNVSVDNVEIRDLTVKGGKASAQTGGGVVNAGKNLVLQRLQITANDAGSFSGGGLSNSGSATLDACTVSSNKAANGAGLSNDLPAASLSLLSTTVENNTASESGGGINNEGSVQLEGRTYVKNNTAPVGGGIQNLGGTVTIKPSTFVTGNTATGGPGTGFGGGINNQLSNTNQRGTITFTAGESFVNDNTSNGGAGSGGGIFNKGTISSDGKSVSSHVTQNTPDQCVNNSGGTGC